MVRRLRHAARYRDGSGGLDLATRMQSGGAAPRTATATAAGGKRNRRCRQQEQNACRCSRPTQFRAQIRHRLSFPSRFVEEAEPLRHAARPVSTGCADAHLPSTGLSQLRRTPVPIHLFGYIYISIKIYRLRFLPTIGPVCIIVSLLSDHIFVISVPASQLVRASHLPRDFPVLESRRGTRPEAGIKRARSAQLPAWERPVARGPKGL